MNLFISMTTEDLISSYLLQYALAWRLAIAAVFLRMAARRLSKAAILAEDYMIVFALVSQWRASPFETSRVRKFGSLVLPTISRRLCAWAKSLRVYSVRSDFDMAILFATRSLRPIYTAVHLGAGNMSFS